jgi:hypothetical protein
VSDPDESFTSLELVSQKICEFKSGDGDFFSPELGIFF